MTSTLVQLIATRTVILTVHAKERWARRFKRKCLWTAISKADWMPTAKIARQRVRCRIGGLYYYDAETCALFALVPDEYGQYMIRTIMKRKI